MNIKPLFDRVLLKKNKPKEVTSAGLILPAGTEDKSSIAFVVSVGSGITENGQTQMQVKPGQKVLFAKFAGSEVKYGDETYIVIKQTDILAILDEEK